MEDNTEIVELKLVLDKELYDKLQKLGEYIFFWDDEKERKFEVEDALKISLLIKILKFKLFLSNN